jgi:hypothetical protein
MVHLLIIQVTQGSVLLIVFIIIIDEDITTLDTTTPSIEMQGPITRSQVQQLRRQVNSFLCSSANDHENRWLPNDLIVIRNQEVDRGGHVGHQEGAGDPRKHTQQGEVQANSESRSLTLSPAWSLGLTCLQIDVQDTSTSNLGDLHIHGKVR